MKSNFGCSLFVLIAFGALPLVHSATKEWKGHSVSFNWNNPDNWEPSGVPQDGDDLYFYANATVDHFGLMVNDMTNLAVNSLRFTANALPGIDWTLSGNTLTVKNIEATFTDDEEVYIECPLRLGGHARFEVGHGSEFFPEVGLHLNAPINLNGFNLLLVEAIDGDLDVAGAIIGSGNVIIDGGVELEGDQPNTFVGMVTLISEMKGNGGIYGAELTLNKSSGPAIPGSLIIGTNSDVKLQREHQIADTSTVVLAPGARLKLEGNTDTISGLSINSYNIPGNHIRDTVVDSGNATLSINDNVTCFNYSTNAPAVIKGTLGLPVGNHVIHVAGSAPHGLNIEAQIIGAGGFTKTGPRGMFLGGQNTFESDAVFQEGGTFLLHSNALGAPSGAAILDGGYLGIQGAIGIETLIVNKATPEFIAGHAALFINGPASWAGPVILNTNLWLDAGPMNFAGAISGPGDMLLWGAYPIQFSGPEANTYTGKTTVNCAALELNKPSGVTAFRGSLVAGTRSINTVREVRWLQDYQCVGADVTLQFDGVINLNGRREDFGPLTFNGGTVTTGAGELGLYGLLTVNGEDRIATIDGRLGLPPGVHEFRINDGGALPDLRINAHILGAGHMRKTGAGQLWLAASNSFTGVTFIDAGTLSVLNAYALGAATAGTTVNEGATLDLNAISATMPESLALRGTGVNGNGALDVFGIAALRSTFPSIYPAIDLTTNTTINVRGGSLLTVDGFISGIGPLTKMGAGTLLLANANENTYSGDTLVADGTLDLAKPNNVMAVPGNLIVGPAPFGSAVLVRWSQSGGVNPNSIITANAGSLLDLNGFSQTIPTLNLNDGADVQTGAGSISFSVGGIVNIGSLDLLGSHAGSTISGNLGLPPNATLTLAVNPFAPTPPFYLGPELEISASIPPPTESPTFERAGLFKSGSGRLQLIGNNSYRGWTDVSEGTLVAASSTALGGALGGTYVFNNATLELVNGITVANENAVLNSTATPALFSWAGDNMWNGLITLQRDSIIGVSTGTEFRAGGVITGTGHLTKTGAGTLIFQGSSHNNYAGETFVNEGPLYLAKAIAITAVPGALSVGTPAGVPAAVVNYGSYQVIGNIFVNRNAIWNVYNQVENVDHLWLIDGGDVAMETGVLSIKTGGTIQVVPGNVTDPATVSGVVEFLAGAHSINVGARSGSSSAPELDVAALLTSAGETITLQKDGPGTLRLAANNNYTGTTVVNAGTLRVDGFQSQSPVRVEAAGTLKGSGAVGNITYSGSGGAVAPGASPGVLSCISFNFGLTGNGILDIELNGPALGTGYDQLSVADVPALAGTTLRATANFVAATNQQFVILNNLEDIPVQGTFNGLPEGAPLKLGDQIFQITYAGGDGNDVVLTKIVDVMRPRLRIERVEPSSVLLLWPTNDPAFTLQFTTNLTGTNFTGWTPVPEVPGLRGTDYAVTNDSSGLHKLYRLWKP